MKKLFIIPILAINTFTFATGSLPNLEDVNVNDGDILVKDIINNLQSNIEKIWNYLKDGIQVNGDIISQALNNNSYGTIKLLDSNSNTGLSIGLGDGKDNIDIKLDNAKYLNFTGGESINFFTQIVSMLPISFKNTNKIIDAYNGDNELHIGFDDKGGIVISTAKDKDDGVILSSSGENIATFKSAGVLIESSDISLKAKGTNKGLRIEKDGDVCIGSCW